MEFSVWISYVATVVILAITPGPSVLLATANSMKYGTNKTMGTILGDLSANLGQIIFAASFPLFINEAAPFLPQAVILTLTFLLLDGLALFIYAKFASKLKGYLEDKEKLHIQNRIVGILLIVSGLMLSMVKKSNH